MPNKTIYIRDGDTTTWEAAERVAFRTGQSTSNLITNLLNDHLAALAGIVNDDVTDPQVVTFTAEVYMARIGSQNLTRTIVDQLDHVRNDDCEPFGRIKTTGDTYITVIGRGPSGSLVRSGRNRPDQVNSDLTIDQRLEKKRAYDEYRNLPLILLAD